MSGQRQPDEPGATDGPGPSTDPTGDPARRPPGDGSPGGDDSTQAYPGPGENPTIDAQGAGPDDPTFRVGAVGPPGQRFRILRPHAEGGLGAVFVALDSDLNREVALKQIQESHADDPPSRRRFLVEAEITGGLEHPGIVPVYALGADDDGRPYYAMRFIRGDSLKETIERFHQDPGPSKALALRQLLRRFTDVCNAIEYAHSRGVLHRDIKPGNVVVGDHGETLVVDWGLAKALGRPSPDDAGRAFLPPPAGGSSETRPGQALGTPTYMSPEQARGDLDAVGPRSDVYSLGATLYSLLTGKPPFRGKPSEVLTDVGRGHFPRPRDLDPGIDPALEAIALKAMATEPDGRYASCRDLADDVDRWLADERVEAYPDPWGRALLRWLARHRTAVAASTAAGLALMAGLAAVAIVQTRARRDLDLKNVELSRSNGQLSRANIALEDSNSRLDAQRSRAEGRERQAIDAVKRFRDAVVEHPELKTNPALESLRKALLKEPLAFFGALREDLQAEGGGSPESMARLADAIDQYARLADEVGDPQDALRANGDGLAIRERLAAGDPGHEEYLAGLSQTRLLRGNLLRTLGRTDEALEAFEKARDAREKLAEAHPDSRRILANLASCHNNIANLLAATNRVRQAGPSYERSLEIWRKLAAAYPDDPDTQADLAVSLTNMGLFYLQTGRYPEALDANERALAIREKLAEAGGGASRFRSDLAIGYLNIGALRNALGQYARALDAFEKAWGLWEVLAREQPAVAQYRSNLAKTRDNIAVILSGSGKQAEALEQLEGSLKIREKLAGDFPAVTEYRVDLAASHNNIGAVLSETQRPGEALASYRKARDIQRAIAEADPSAATNRFNLALSHNNIGLLLSDLGQAEEAVQEHEKALAIRRELAGQNPRSPDFAANLAASLYNLGELDLEAERPAPARERLREADEQQRKAMAASPGNPRHRDALARILAGLIRADQALGLAGEAAEARDRLDAIRAGDDPTRLDARLVQVLRGAAPLDNPERLALAQRAYDTRRFADAAGLWGDAFEADPGLAESRDPQHRYNAACAAALAASGEGINPPEGGARERLRSAALGWLKAELDAWAPLVDRGPPQARAFVAQTLRHWEQDSDLRHVRDVAPRSALPESERDDWRAFWDGVESLRARAASAP
ncbi:MAG: tetratricopeptide repeat protein [Isosphaeraceae bacterium]